MTLRRYPNSKTWYYQCQINGKKWSRPTGETDKRRAKAKVAELEAQAKLLRKRPERSPKLSRAIVAEINRIESDVSHQAAERTRYALKNFIAWLGRDTLLEKIDFKLLEEYQRHRLRKAAVNTVNRELYAICSLLRENGFRIPKPAHKPGRKTEQREFTADELRRFFDACTDEFHRNLFLLLLATGARPAEVLPSERSGHVALLKKEVEPATCSVTIRTAKARQGQKIKSRVIQIPEDLMDRLVRQMDHIAGPHVFPPNGALAKLFDRILGRAGIPKVDELGRKLTAHSFRHTYATLQASAVPFNPFLLKAIMGHSQLSTTDRYCHPRSEAQVVDVASLLGGVTPSEKAAGLEQSASRKFKDISGI